MGRCMRCMMEYKGEGVCPHCGYVPGSPLKEPFQLVPGIVLHNRYLIGTSIGVGGFGITYVAWDNTLKQKVCVKEFYPSANGYVTRTPGEPQVLVFNKAKVDFEAGKQRFLNEARVMAKFNTHPNIVHVFDFFEANGTAYIAMEYLDGIPYKEFIRSNGQKINVETAKRVTLSVLDALKEVHKSGIIHRDISPDNVFVTNRGMIKVIDFGAARLSAGEEEKTYSVVLKPGYAPVEQYRTKSSQGPWTDMYAVGAMFYRAITGRMPDESVNRMVKDELPPPHALDPSIPENISNAIMRAMAVDQRLRFRSADEFRDALKSTTPVRNVEEETGHRNIIAAAVAAGAALLIAGGIGFSGFGVLKQQAAMKLAGTGITVWYPEKKDTPEDFDGMLESFRKEYPQVDIQVTAIPEEEYREKLIKALEAGEAPTVFDSTCLGREYNDSLAPLDDSLGFLKNRSWVKDYRFLDQYDRLFPKHLHMPLSYQAPVIYADTKLAEAYPETVSTGDELKALAGTSYAGDPEAAGEYEQLMTVSTARGYDDFVVYVGEEGGGTAGDAGSNAASAAASLAEKARNMLEGKAVYYLSDTEEYRRIQQDMSGLYGMVFLEDAPVTGRFTNLWSVSAGSGKEEKKAGIRLVYYMLSGDSQQILNLRNGGGIPMNQDIFQQYIALNSELSGLSGELSDLTMERYPEE